MALCKEKGGEIWRSASKKYYMVLEKDVWCYIDGMFDSFSDNASREKRRS